MSSPPPSNTPPPPPGLPCQRWNEIIPYFSQNFVLSFVRPMQYQPKSTHYFAQHNRLLEVPGSNQASPTMILGAAGSSCNTVKYQGREGHLSLGQKKFVGIQHVPYLRENVFVPPLLSWHTVRKVLADFAVCD